MLPFISSSPPSIGRFRQDSRVRKNRFQVKYILHPKFLPSHSWGRIRRNVLDFTFTYLVPGTVHV